MKKILLAGALAATTLLGASTVSAGIIQLGFILDRSGSIGSGNWNTIVTGLSDAVGSIIPVTGDDQYEISVVTFASTATININSVLVTDVTSRAALAAQIAGLTSVYSGGLTNYADAFTKMTTALNDVTGVNMSVAEFSYVNFATDGVPTTGGDGVAARNAAISAGVDNISIEGIGGGVNAASLQSNFCYPQPCDTTDPYNFPTQGFYIGVADAQAYVDAIENKIRVVTDQLVPAPAPIALLGFGLIGGLMMRRKRAATRS